MSIRHQVLGVPGRDNALYVEIDTGQAIHRLLFDCGDGCLNDLSISQVQSIDGLFFSHFHVDHVAGFDMFLRCNFCREDKPVEVWGPTGASETIHHRLRGVTWNLVDKAPGAFDVHEIKSDVITIDRFLTCEGFATAHPQEPKHFDRTIVGAPDYCVEALLLDHGTPSIAYVVRETERMNIDTSELQRLGFRPGPWLKAVKDPGVDDDEEVAVNGQSLSVGDLRRQLLRTIPGESIAYLTDFRLNSGTEERLVAMLQGCTVIVCENNFRNEDRELAERSFHMVSNDVAQLACQAGAERLVLFHLSDRYTREQWNEQLEEVRAVFPNTVFPDSWQLAASGTRTSGRSTA
jgi:ribonuclease Z